MAGRMERAAVGFMLLYLGTQVVHMGYRDEHAKRRVYRPTPPAPPRWRYDRRVCSGLGDRLCLLFAMAGLGRAAGAHVSVRWCESDGERRYDLAEFNRSFPSLAGASFVPDSLFDAQTEGMPDVRHTNTELRAAEGYDCVYTLAPRTFVAPGPFGDYQAAYRAEGRIKPDPSRYVALHVRGGDKKTPPARFCTAEALRAVARAGLRIVVVSDDPELAQAVAPNAPLAPDGDVYHHLALLRGAAGIVQHSPDGWSAFSSSLAMFHGIPLLNTWRGPFNRIREFERLGGHTPELRMCGRYDVARFVAQVSESPQK